MDTPDFGCSSAFPLNRDCHIYQLQERLSVKWNAQLKWFNLSVVMSGQKTAIRSEQLKVYLNSVAKWTPHAEKWKLV